MGRRRQNISNDDHGLAEACCAWPLEHQRSETLKPCLRAPDMEPWSPLLTAWRNGKARGFQPMVLHALMCMDCRRAEREAGLWRGSGDGHWGQHRSGSRPLLGSGVDRGSLTVLHAHVVFRAEAGREAGNLCLTEAVK